MSFITDNVRYQPQFNSVLDEVEELKCRVEELERENSRLYRLLDSLDERINILTDDKR